MTISFLWLIQMVLIIISLKVRRSERGFILAEVDFSKLQASAKYVCSICGYVYDPAEHDGVAFENMPEDWKCPRCKRPKDKFNRA